MNHADLLRNRLRALNYEGPLDTAEDCRTAILSLLCAEAVACRLPPSTKVLTFRALFAAVFNQPLDTRERAAKRRAG